MALHMLRVPEGGWGVCLWKHMPLVGKDTLLALDVADQLRYVPMKEALIGKFGLTSEKYRLNFRNSQKQAHWY